MRWSLPQMQCDDHCGECCGPTFCSPPELRAIQEYVSLHHLMPLKQGLTCPWYQGGRCAIHPVRPTICQLFGHSPKLVCCKGYNRNVPAIRERQIMAHTMSFEPLWLHGCVYSDAEMLVLLKREMDR